MYEQFNVASVFIISMKYQKKTLTVEIKIEIYFLALSINDCISFSTGRTVVHVAKSSLSFLSTFIQISNI